MNPLIKELASKVLEWPDTDNDGLTVFNNDELEKFAELIVKECAGVALMSNGNNLYVCELIKEHIGVEECE